MQCIIFSYSKSVNNLKILVSLSNKWFNNLSLLFSVSPFSLFTSFILSFADSLISLSFSKPYHFLQNLYLSSKVVKPTSYFSNISLISSSSTFYFPFVSFFISFISCSLSNFRFFISFNIFFKPFSLSLNSSIILYVYESAKERDIFEKLTVCFDLVSKSLYSFSESVELRSISIQLEKDFE